VIAMTARPHRSRRTQALKRRLGLEPNTLRRPADHVESSLIVTLLLVFVIGAPLLGLVAGLASYETSLRVERAEAARQQVTARLTANAPTPAPAVDAAPPTVPAAAQWTYAGTVHSGLVRVRPGTKADAKVPIRVDGKGRAMNGQRTHSETVAHAVIMGVASVFCVAFAVWLAVSLVRRVFIYRHLAAWGADWSAAEPRWSGRTGL
jgi:hypothetical protein